MRIVLASSEAVPFSKTGGLGDVASALSKALAAAGHEVWLIIPHYPRAMPNAAEDLPKILASGQSVTVAVGAKQVDGELLQSTLPGSNVQVLLVSQPDYFDRSSLYVENGKDYPDNCERFCFFSRAVTEAALSLDLRPDIIHAHDWQTGLIPALLEIELRATAAFSRTRSVFTVHNLAFQGQFWHWDMLLTGLDWKYFNWKQMESFEHLNLMKTGIVFADMVTTVSPSYSGEIQTAEFGCQLEGVLSARRDDLVGILNGVDTDTWNPRTDPALAQNYSVETVLEGKAACKARLQEMLGLPVRADVPLFGMISRMTDQKGLDLIAGCRDEICQHDLQLCFLGTGEENYETMLRGMAESYRDKVATRIGFDEELAHQIEAGADVYLMPSRYEPCGLNQLYSQIYGTVPLVRAVGGLADSVIDATAENLSRKTATGFCFDPYDPASLASHVSRAVESYRDRPMWMQLIETGMRQDWSWNRSAADYVSVYENAMSKCEAAGVC
jgi:starch synthase